MLSPIETINTERDYENGIPANDFGRGATSGTNSIKNITVEQTDKNACNRGFLPCFNSHVDEPLHLLLDARSA